VFRAAWNQQFVVAAAPLEEERRWRMYVRAKRRYQTARHHILQDLALIFTAKRTSTSYLDKSQIDRIERAGYDLRKE
jgi:hypothetical protein